MRRHLVRGGWTVLVAMTAVAAAAAPGTSPPVMRLLGPLPAPPAAPAAGPMVPAMEPVPELDPAAVDPFVGGKVLLDPRGSVEWRDEKVPAAGLALPEPGVWWLATRLDARRWTRVTVTVGGPTELTLWCDGAPAPLTDADGRRTATLGLARGSHTLLLRAMRGDQDAAVTLAAAGEPAGALEWSLATRVAPMTFDPLLRALVGIGPLAVSSDGEMVAWGRTVHAARGDDDTTTTELIDASGAPVATAVGGPGVTPVAFLPGGHSIILRRDRAKGDGTVSDVLQYDADALTLTTVVRDEPDLAKVLVGPGGTHLLLLSSRGAGDLDPAPGEPWRRRGLRDRMPDWTPRRQLWLVEVDTGARRRLTAPGDWVVDDAAFVPARQALVYARTVPLKERPWYATEIRLLDLRGGEDRLVATFTGGWENHPHALAPDLRGRRVAFIGPPAQVTPDGPGHNAYQGTLWVLDLDSGTLTKAAADAPFSFGGSGDMLAWERAGTALLTTATDGGRTRLVRVAEGADGWQVERLTPGTSVLAGAAIAPDLSAVAYVASRRREPPELRMRRFDKPDSEIVLARPNAGIRERFTLAEPTDTPYTGPGGELLEAWYYPPTGAAVTGAKIPLVVYFYGGATPTKRSFSAEHQVLAGAGYGVLVVNPRGACGRGLAFADEHVGDWGPKAAADVLAGVDALLAAHPEIDPKRIGVYGGSYGGFLTEYLVSESDRFAAAVAMYGIADIASYWGDGAWGLTYGDSALAGSFPWSNQDLFAGHSPVYRADHITTPLLMLHGDADVNVPAEESEQLYTALAAQGKTVQLVRFPGGTHMLQQPLSTRVAHLQALLDWFDRFLDGQPEGWQANWESRK